MTRSRFDRSTFKGRIFGMLNRVDPFTLLCSNADIKAAQQTLAAFKAGERGTKTDSELWHARKLVDSAVHPDSGESVGQAFRMSGYRTFNGPVCVMMMWSSSLAY